MNIPSTRGDNSGATRDPTNGAIIENATVVPKEISSCSHQVNCFCFFIGFRGWITSMVSNAFPYTNAIFIYACAGACAVAGATIAVNTVSTIEPLAWQYSLYTPISLLIVSTLPTFIASV
jgi:hypothetical protein